MEAVWAALIALASAVIVKILDWAFSRKDKRDGVLDDIQRNVRSTQTEIKALRDEVRENQAIDCRMRILRFADDLMHDLDHSKDYYDTVMQDITEYDLYCSQHSDFRNAVTTTAAKVIARRYEQHMQDKDFL